MAKKTPISTFTSKADGYVKGEPRTFVPGHHYRCRQSRSVAERFWEKVDKRGVDECWEWTAARFPAGYGALASHERGKPWYAHRVSYELHNGPILEGRHVMHMCDNPPCVNPTHLRVGTRDENMADMAMKGRSRGARGEKHRSAKLTAAEVLEIRAAYAAGDASQSVLGRRYGVTKVTIGHIVTRRTWAWL